MADLSIVYEYSPNTWMYTFKNVPLQPYQYAGITFKTSRGMYTFGVVCDAGLSISNFQCDEYLNGNFRQTRYCTLVTTTYGGVTYNIYTASMMDSSPIPCTSGITLDCEELSVDTQELNAAIGAYFAQFVNYRYYLDVNGNEEYFEWLGATAGGWVFDLKRAVSRPSSDYDHLAVLAYDLRQVPNPSVTNMYYSYWGQNMSTVYRESDQDVYIVYSNLTCLDTDNPRRYDVQLESDNRYWTTMCADIRAYWDGLGGVENIYVGVNGKAQEVKKLYVGVNGKAQEVKAIYVGVNGKARKVF